MVCIFFSLLGCEVLEGKNEGPVLSGTPVLTAHTPTNDPFMYSLFPISVLLVMLFHSLIFSPFSVICVSCKIDYISPDNSFSLQSIYAPHRDRSDAPASVMQITPFRCFCSASNCNKLTQPRI